MIAVSLKPLCHRNQESIGIYYQTDSSLNNIIRKLPGVRWSQANKCWYIPLNSDSYNHAYKALNGKAELDITLLKQYLEKRKKVIVTAASSASKQNMASPVSITSPAWKLSTENLEALNKFIQLLMLKAYSVSTIKTYRNEFIQLLQLLKKKPVNELTADDLKRYLVYCYEKLHLTENTLHSRINALKFYSEQVLGREKFFWEIPRPKKQLQLPNFFNQDEIAAILNAVGNIKHKTMLMLAYSAGLRVSEVVTIKTKNIDSKRRCILIEQAKGKKDRMVMLSPIFLIMLREYWKSAKPSREGYLFPGQYKGEAYSSRSLQLVIGAAKKKAGVLKPGSIHALRHSFATHLLDKGTDVTMIMKLLGHNGIKTTLRYLHVTNRDMLQVLSPLDDLYLI